MDEATFTKMLMDSKVSDRAVFRALLLYLKNKEKTAEHATLAADEEFANLVAKRRPAVWKKFMEFVTEGHKYCCGPNAIQDADWFLARTYKTVRVWFWRVKFYFKYGE